MSGRGANFRLKATNETNRAFNGVQGNIRKTQGLQRSWNRGLNANRRAVQQFGFQMSDFAIQIAGGQSAMLAFTQQGGQMLQFFGPAGSIMAAFLAVFGSLAIAFLKSGKALSDLTPILGVLQEDFAALGRVLGVVKEIMIDFANIILNNMDRILITSATVVGLFAGRWVVAFVAARIATFSLVGALAALRTILIRIGITALIVGLGEAIFRFTQLVKAAGGFGEALVMLKAVAVEAWGRIVEAFDIVVLRFTAGVDNMKGSFFVFLQNLLDQMDVAVNTIIGSFVGAFNAIIAVWQNMPAAFKRIAQQAVVALIDTLQGGIDAAVGAINGLLEAVSLPTIPAPDLSQFKPGIDEAVDIAGKAGDAFKTAFNGNYTGEGGIGGGALGQLGQDLKNASVTAGELADVMTERLGRPIRSITDIREALAQLDAEGKDIDIRDWFNGGGGDDDKKGGGGGGGKKGIAAKLSEEAKKVKKVFDDLSGHISSTLGSAFNSLRDKTKSFGDVVQDTVVSILNKLTDLMLAPVWENIGNNLARIMIGTPGTGGGLSGGWLSGVFKNLLNFDGGGFTGQGSRSGGLDGKGGKLAMVHPNETVIDHTKARGGRSAATGNLEVHVHENARDEQTEVAQSDGRIDIFLRKLVVNTIAEGHGDVALRRYGLKPQAQGI